MVVGTVRQKEAVHDNGVNSCSSRTKSSEFFDDRRTGEIIPGLIDRSINIERNVTNGSFLSIVTPDQQFYLLVSLKYPSLSFIINKNVQLYNFLHKTLY